MAALTTGGCRCGTVRYECTADFIATTLCYCRDCQRSSGSAVGCFVLIPPEGMLRRSGSTTCYTVQNDSGRTITREFCGECGSPLFAWTKNIFAVTAASFDNPAGIMPSMAIWVDSAQPWAPIPCGIERFAKNPPISAG
jgi:hypothetical protein